MRTFICSALIIALALMGQQLLVKTSEAQGIHAASMPIAVPNR